MNSRHLRLAALPAVLVLSLALPALAHAAGSFSGTVTAEASGNPIANLCIGARGPGNEIRITSTDANGDYSLTGLAAGDWRVGFQPPGCSQNPNFAGEYWNNRSSEAQADPIAVVDDQTTEDIDAALAPAPNSSIAGRVTAAGGGPVAGLCVGAQSASGALAFATTDSNGDYTLSNLAAGGWKLQFNWCNNPNWVSEYYDDTQVQAEADTVTVVNGQQTPGIDAELAAPARITGTVTAGGSPAGGICVQALSGAGATSTATTAPDGTYTLGGLGPGEYKVGFSDCFTPQDDYAPEWWNGKDSRDGADTVTLSAGEVSAGKDAELELGGAIAGTVTASDGSPLANACAVAERPGVSPAFANADANGEYTVRGLASGDYIVTFSDCDNLEPVHANEHYSDTFSREDADPVTVTAPATTEDVDAQLALAASISGDLTVAGGGPATSACVGLYRASADDAFDLERWVNVAVADTAGHYSIGGLQPGAYKLAFGDCAIGGLASAPPYGAEYWDDRRTFAAADQIDLAPGTSLDADAELALGGRISGTVSDPDGPAGGVCVTAEDPADGTMVAADVSAADGSYRLPGVPAGSWAVHFHTCADGSATGLEGEYHADKPSRATADPVAVSANGAVNGIDATLAFATPETTITSGPAGGSETSATSAAFGFDADEPASFECKLDAGAFEPCSSPRSYSGLASGSHTFSVRAVAAHPDPTPATRTWTVNPASTTQTTEGEVEPGETVSTDPAGSGPTPANPTTAAVTTPTGGAVTIESGPAGPEPAGFNFLGRQFEITAPDATEEDPLVLEFVLDQSAIPGGTDPEDVQVMRDGAAAGDCTEPVVAVPDPCVATRELAGGDLRIVVRSSHASTWNLGIAEPAPAGKCRVPMLIGRKLAKAKAKIAETKCKLGTVRTVRTNLIPKDIVLLQKPLPWLVRPAGTAIDLWVSARR